MKNSPVFYVYDDDDILAYDNESGDPELTKVKQYEVAAHKL